MIPDTRFWKSGMTRDDAGHGGISGGGSWGCTGSELLVLGRVGIWKLGLLGAL
jgi:hypothetical protein